ncbi:MAG: Flp family type IVb pilin [Nocardioidaceae bacterium]
MLTQIKAFATIIIALNGKRKSEEGATAVEYGLMVAAIAAIIVGVVFAIGVLVDGAFTTTENCISTRGAGANC